MSQNSSQNPQAGSLEARVSVVEAELKHLATKADLEKMGKELSRELSGKITDLQAAMSREIRQVLFAVLAAMGVMMSTIAGLAVAYAPHDPPPPPPPALEAPSP